MTQLNNKEKIAPTNTTSIPWFIVINKSGKIERIVETLDQDVPQIVSIHMHFKDKLQFLSIRGTPTRNLDYHQ